MYYILENQKPKAVSEAEYYEYWRRTTGSLWRDYIDGTMISTVFLGCGYSCDNELPLLFETMVFGGLDHEFQERYYTWEDAEKGHQRAINMVKGGNILQENNLL